MNKDFLRLINNVFSGMVSKHGFNRIGEGYDPSAFGDSFITFESQDLRLRFTRDRGFYCIDIAPVFPTNKKWGPWEPVSLVFEYLNQPDCALLLEPRDEPNTWSEKSMRCLDDNYGLLKQAFGAEGYPVFSQAFDRFARDKFHTQTIRRTTER